MAEAKRRFRKVLTVQEQSTLVRATMETKGDFEAAKAALPEIAPAVLDKWKAWALERAGFAPKPAKKAEPKKSDAKPDPLE